MKFLLGVLLLPLFMSNGKSHNKIDKRLLTKTMTLGNSNLSAIVYSKENKEPICKKHLKKLGVKIKYDLPLIHAYAVEIPSEKLKDMASSEVVEYVSDDVKMNSLLNVAAQVTGSRLANDTGFTGKGIGIAVLDTGIYPHNDFTKPVNRIAAFKDFINNREQPYDDNGHGTFVAGVAAGNGYMSNGKYTGIAPKANIISIKVMDEDGSGNSSDIIAGMQWAVDHQKEYNIRVMCLSLGSKAEDNRFDPLVAAVEAVWKKGIVVVAAAGNSGPERNTITTPGISTAIITVGAVDDKRTVDTKDDTIPKFSSRGPALGRLAKPDIVAPGVDINAPNADKNYTSGSKIRSSKDSYRTMSGTSVSAPVVAGIAALMLEKNPDLKPAEVKQAMMDNAVKINAGKYDQGKGIVNIKNIMNI